MRLSLSEEKETIVEEILYIFLGIDLCALTSTFYRNRFRYRMHFPEIVEIVHDKLFIVLGIDLLHVRCDIMLPLAKTFKVKNVKTLLISTTFTLMGIEF